MEQEKIEKLKQWMELDSDVYMKGWDEKSKTAYYVFPKNCTLWFGEMLKDPKGIIVWLADNGFTIKAYITDYTYKTLGRGRNRTLRNRIRLDISWE